MSQLDENPENAKLIHSRHEFVESSSGPQSPGHGNPCVLALSVTSNLVEHPFDIRRPRDEPNVLSLGKVRVPLAKHLTVAQIPLTRPENAPRIKRQLVDGPGADDWRTLSLGK